MNHAFWEITPFVSVGIDSFKIHAQLYALFQFAYTQSGDAILSSQLLDLHVNTLYWAFHRLCIECCLLSTQDNPYEIIVFCRFSWTTRTSRSQR